MRVQLFGSAHSSMSTHAPPFSSKPAAQVIGVPVAGGVGVVGTEASGVLVGGVVVGGTHALPLVV